MVKLELFYMQQEIVWYFYKFNPVNSWKHNNIYHGVGAVAMMLSNELPVEPRQDRKMTQEDLAKVLFVTSGTISNYENGVHLPDIEKLISLADIFDVTTDYLLGRCTSCLSTDVLDMIVVEDRTAGDLIQDIQNFHQSGNER